MGTGEQHEVEQQQMTQIFIFMESNIQHTTIEQHKTCDEPNSSSVGRTNLYSKDITQNKQN